MRCPSRHHTRKPYESGRQQALVKDRIRVRVGIPELKDNYSLDTPDHRFYACPFDVERLHFQFGDIGGHHVLA